MDRLAQAQIGQKTITLLLILGFSNYEGSSGDSGSCGSSGDSGS